MFKFGFVKKEDEEDFRNDFALVFPSTAIKKFNKSNYKEYWASEDDKLKIKFIY